MHVLQRGYAIIQKEETPVASINDVNAGDEVTIRFYDGEATCSINEVSIYEL